MSLSHPFIHRVKAVLKEQFPLFEKYAPTACFLTVGILHFYLVYAQDLTQWKGGGFGMFSTVDSGGMRAVRIELESEGRRYGAYLSQSKEVQRLVSFVRHLPSDSNLAALAEMLGEALWVDLEDGSAVQEREFDFFLADMDQGWGVYDLPMLSRKAFGAAVYKKRLTLWNDQRALEGRVCPVDRVALSVYRPEYSIESRELKMQLLKSVEAKGRTLNDLAESRGYSVNYLRQHRAKTR